MRIVYLHGFASSPQSSKAQFFRRKFSERGIPIEIPRLDQGDFQGLTITGQLGVVERAVAGGPAVLMGSSLGGYLAAAYAARHPVAAGGRAAGGRVEVERLILLAPAFRFPSRWAGRFVAGEMARWKETGSLPFFHYGDKKEVALGYEFVEDAGRYEDEPAFDQPALILHGNEDPVVPVEVSRTFAASHPNVRLRVLASGHELTDVLEELWIETAAFLRLD